MIILGGVSWQNALSTRSKSRDLFIRFLRHKHTSVERIEWAITRKPCDLRHLDPFILSPEPLLAPLISPSIAARAITPIRFELPLKSHHDVTSTYQTSDRSLSVQEASIPSTSNFHIFGSEMSTQQHGCSCPKTRGQKGS